MAGFFPRTYEVTIESGALLAGPRPPLPFDAPPEFGGDPHAWTPEHLLVAATASCFAATFASMTKRAHISVASYKCTARATLERTGFAAIELAVELTVLAPEIAVAQELLVDAKKQCFVANSLRCPVDVTSKIHGVTAAA